MIHFKKAEILLQYILEQKKKGLKIGFVPTMGALHEGHLSLIKSSRKNNDITVCSIFVNPTQFNNKEDFNHYPVTIEADIVKLIATGCDVLFIPTKNEIYPADYQARPYPLGQIEEVLEGYYRPGHFQGVCQVVDRLLEITKPDNLYLGAKDYQQCKVISKLVSLIGKQEEINVNIEPTFREEDGLAMSSRNLRLSPAQRKIAPAIFEALELIQKNSNGADLQKVEDEAKAFLVGKGFKIDYLQVADSDTLLPASQNNVPKIVLVAAYLDGIRLIDNLPLN